MKKKRLVEYLIDEKVFLERLKIRGSIDFIHHVHRISKQDQVIVRVIENEDEQNGK